MEAATSLAESTGVSAAVESLGLSRATFYRARTAPSRPEKTSVKKRSPRALSAEERAQILAELHSDRFVDCSPRTVYATLLDEGRYLGSIRSMYRILEEAQEVRERRNQLRHPSYAKPELLATKPNEVWSWDITKLLGPQKWTYYYLYVILDIFSRHVVGWLLAERESSELAMRLIRETIEKQNVDPGRLTIHSDRGASMGSKLVAQLLADLGVTKTHSRPHVSNDNPFSEAQFKTLKYRPEFPDRFGSLEDGRSFSRSFFNWYNNDHRHSGIGLMTPASVHYGEAEAIRDARNAVLDEAYRRNPERFVRKRPQAPALPTAVWINPPAGAASEEGQDGGGPAAVERSDSSPAAIATHTPSTEEPRAS